MKWSIWGKLGIVGFYICNLLLSSNIYSQDLEEVAKNIKDPKLEVTGIISASAQFYTTDAINRSVPLSGNLSTMLNFNFMGISAPFAIHMGSGGELFNYRLPSYSFIGVSPKYKSLTLHIGDRVLSHSKYGFSGHSFRGVGFEFKPDIWFVSGFYGRLQRAKQEDLVGNHQLEPLYKRMGWGFSGGIDMNQKKLILSLFSAKDIENSLSSVDSTFNFTPGSNTILSLEGAAPLSKILSIKSNVSYSGYTENVNEETLIGASYFRSFGGLLESNLSTRWNFAFNTEVNVKTKRGNIGAGYERVDPGYRTFGALFFQNDIQQLYLKLNTRFFRNKVLFGGRIGVRNNDLNSDQANKYNRFISSFNITYNPNDLLSLTGSYSSFRNVNKKNFVLDPISPLLFTTFVLNNNTATLGASYYLKKSKDQNSIIRLNGDYSAGRTIVNDEVDQNANFNSLSTNLIYQHTDFTNDISYNIFLNNRISKLSGSDILLTSLGINGSKSFDEDRFLLGSQISVTRNLRESEISKQNGYLVNLGINSSFKLTENINIGLRNMYLHNRVSEGLMSSVSEFRCLLNCTAALK